MQDNESIKNELQTLIMLEQQQAGALHQLNNKATFPGGNGFGGGGFMGGNMFSSLYGPSSYGAVGNSGQTLYDRAVNGVINSVNNVNASMRHAALAANLDSSSFIWRNQSKMSAEARELQASRFGEKMTGGAVSALSSGAGLLTSMAGFVPGLVGGAAVGVTAGIAADQLKQNFAYDQYLMQNSYRFINMYESNNKRGVGGFNRNERWDVANWLRNFNTEMKISDEDTMTILKGFTEGDLLREADNVDTFKKQMKLLTKTLKTMSLTLNESFEEIADLMAEMKKKGIDTRNYQAYSSSAKITGGLIGAEASEVLQYQMNTAAALTQGTSLSTDRMMNTVNSTQAYMGKFYDESLQNKDIDARAEENYNRIVNRGGIDGATTDYLNLTSSIIRGDNTVSKAAAAFMNWDNGTFTLDEAMLNKAANGDYTMQELTNMATQKLNSTGWRKSGATAAWLANGGDYFENSLLDVTDRSKWLKAMITSARLGNKEGYANFSDSEILSTVLGLAGGQDSLFLSDFNNYIYNDGGDYYNKMLSATVAESFIQKANANRTSLGYSLKNQFGKFTDFMGDVVSPIGRLAGRAGEAIQDLWYGKNIYDVKSLWSNTDFTSNPFNDLTEALDDLNKTLNDSSVAFSNDTKSILSGLRDTLSSSTQSNSSKEYDYIRNFQFSSLGSSLLDSKTYVRSAISENFADNVNLGRVTGNAAYSIAFPNLITLGGLIKEGVGAFRTSSNSGKNAYRGDAAAYFNEAIGLNLTPELNGSFSASQEKQIMENAQKKVRDSLNSLLSGKPLSSEDREAIQIYRNYESMVGSNFVGAMVGDYNKQNGTSWGVAGQSLFKNDSNGNVIDLNDSGAGSTSYLNWNGYDKNNSFIKNMEKLDDEIEKVKNDWESAKTKAAKNGYSGKYQSKATELEKQYRTLIGFQDSLGEAQDWTKSNAEMLPIFAQLVGYSDREAAGIKKKILNSKSPAAVVEAINSDIANTVFSSLDGVDYTGKTLSQAGIEELRTKLLNSSLVRSATPNTEYAESIIDQWIQSSNLSQGGKVSRNAMSSLIQQLENVAGGTGVLQDKQLAAEEKDMRTNISEMNENVKRLVERVYFGDGSKVYNEHTDEYYEGASARRESNKNGTTSSGVFSDKRTRAT